MFRGVRPVGGDALRIRRSRSRQFCSTSQRSSHVEESDNGRPAKVRTPVPRRRVWKSAVASLATPALCGGAFAEAVFGRPLPIPPLMDVGEDAGNRLDAIHGTRAFLAGAEARTMDWSQDFPIPRRGDRTSLFQTGARGPTMMMAAPRRQRLMPIRSHRSGRTPSTAQSHSSEAAM